MGRARIFSNKHELIEALVGKDDVVLDVGFSGQGVTREDPNWPHGLLQKRARKVYGIDLAIDRAAFPDTERYHEASAELFSFPGVRFDVIFAGDVIEHLPNPGLFLARVKEHLSPRGILVLTTPNAFNLFNLTEKLTKDEPTVNSDHTCYFNHKTLRVLAQKCGFDTTEVAYLYTLGYRHKESWKKKAQNALYAFLATMTPKFVETLVVVARPQNPS
jgi:2-polyprenyl-3-methyl-5-hydroxy-6-metoxy-1,4-benzoquinol methylase